MLLEACETSCTLAAPSAFHCDWVSNHYHQELHKALRAQWGGDVRLEICVHACAQARVAQQVDETNGVHEAHNTPQVFKTASTQGIQRSFVPWKSSPFNPHFVFDTFVAGTCNRVSLAACQEVCDVLGQRYNPLVLFGDSGVGKTHLLQAVGAHLVQQKPELNIVYMRCEQWVNHYIWAVRHHEFDAFRDFFRARCDVLLLDDIQFLAGKAASQDEFFHTFNTLSEMGKQVVLTCDRCPRQIDGLHQQLQTRLAGGLAVDVRAPQSETRSAIVQAKAQKAGVHMPQEVADYIAQRMMASVRELEGAVNRVTAFARMAHIPLTLDTAKQSLSAFVRHKAAPLSMQQVCDCVATYYGMQVEDLQGKSQRKHVCTARHVAMWLCNTHLQISLVQIGQYFGARSHTTALASVHKIEQRRKCNVSLQSTLSRMQSLLKSQ